MASFLIEAVKSQQIQEVSQHLNDIAARDQCELSALHWAFLGENQEIRALLIDKVMAEEGSLAQLAEEALLKGIIKSDKYVPFGKKPLPKDKGRLFSLATLSLEDKSDIHEATLGFAHLAQLCYEQANQSKSHKLELLKWAYIFNHAALYNSDSAKIKKVQRAIRQELTDLGYEAFSELASSANRVAVLYQVKKRIMPS